MGLTHITLNETLSTCHTFAVAMAAAAASNTTKLLSSTIGSPYCFDPGGLVGSCCFLVGSVIPVNNGWWRHFLLYTIHT